MSKVEFLQMVPALLFGISLAEISMFLGKASKGKVKLYWEHLVIILIAFDAIIFNWYIFYDRINVMEESYLNFVIQILSPLACLIFVANLLVENDFPEENRIKYFMIHKKKIFLSLAVFVGINVSTVMYFHHYTHFGFFPLIPVVVMLINAFYDFKWLRIMGYIIKGIQMIAVCYYLK
jgi:hypothetical protein